VDGDLRALVISGHPSDTTLYTAWETLYEAFLDAMKDKDGLYKVRLLNKITLLDFNYKLIRLCLDFLKKAYHPAVETSLRKHVRLGILNPHDRDDYLRCLKVADARAQRYLVELETLQAEYAILQKKTEGQKPVSHDHFRSLITQVSHFMKFRINPREITTGEFASYYCMMRETNDLIRSQQKRRA